MSGLPGLFDVDERLKRLSDLAINCMAFAGAVISRFSGPIWIGRWDIRTERRAAGRHSMRC